MSNSWVSLRSGPRRWESSPVSKVFLWLYIHAGAFFSAKKASMLVTSCWVRTPAFFVFGMLRIVQTAFAVEKPMPWILSKALERGRLPSRSVLRTRWNGLMVSSVKVPPLDKG